MLTLQELQKEAKKLRADFEPVSRTVRLVSTAVDVDNDTLLCSGTAPSTAAGKSYDLVIQFHEVTFALEPNPLTPVRLETRVRGRGPRTIIYAEQMSDDRHPVQIRCECSDFRFAWMHALKLKDSLYGTEIPYVRKTTTRPPRNPQDIPGYCKHILDYLDVLKERNILSRT
jgi:hypothetical protein